MTALHSAVKKSKTKQFIAMVVEPIANFRPSNWQDTPQSYRVVEITGNKKHRGEADAWRFLFNRDVLKANGSIQRWGIWVAT